MLVFFFIDVCVNYIWFIFIKFYGVWNILGWVIILKKIICLVIKGIRLGLKMLFNF